MTAATCIPPLLQGKNPTRLSYAQGRNRAPTGFDFLKKATGEEDVEQVRLFSPVRDVVVSNLPHRRQRDGVYEIELPFNMPTGFYILEVTDREGWQAQAKVLIGTP
jgi:hypothetical protein